MRKPQSCQGCPLYDKGVGFCSPEGDGANKVLIVSDSLGAYEAKDGLPFRPWGETGSVLERAIVSLGYTRSQFVLYSVVACQPPGNELAGAPYEHEAVNHCSRHLEAVIKRYQPKVILALGAVAARSLTGLSGDKLGIDMIQGFVLPCLQYPEVRIICSYSPAYIVRGQWEVFPLLRMAIRKAVVTAQMMRDGTCKEESLDYREEGTLDDLKDLEKRLLSDPSRTLSYDFETQGEDQEVPNFELDLDDDEEGDELGGRKKKKERISVFQQITQVNFTDEIGTGIAVQLHRENIDTVKRIFAHGNPKVGHNVWNFDNGVAAFNGIYLGGPLADDTIWQFHHLYPDLPGRKGKVGVGDQADKDMGSLAPLQFCASVYGFPFPWKHFFKEKPGFYGCLHAQSLVETEVGKRQIVDLVREQYNGLVKGIDSSGQFAWGRVTGWYKQFQPEDVPWLTVCTEVTQVGRWGKLATRYTPNHELMTSEGWCSVDAIRPGMKIATPHARLNYIERQVVIGSMCGDGCLQKRNKLSGWPILTITHCEAQCDYLNWKTSLLEKGPLNGVVNLHHDLRKSAVIAGKVTKRTQHSVFKSPRHPELEVCYQEIYGASNGAFKIAGAWLRQMEPLALAIAYMDNGTLANKRYPRFYLPFRTREDCEVFASVLKANFGIEGNLSGPSKGCYLFLVSAATSHRLFNVIAPYVHPVMRYKLPEPYHVCVFNERPICQSERPGPFYAHVIAVEASPVVRYSNSYYCLTVEGVESFCTEHEIAHNCCDSDAALQVHLGVARDLQSILCDPSSGRTAWDGYVEMVYEIQPIFAEMNRRGIPVNKEKLMAFTRKILQESKRVYSKMIVDYVPREILQPQQKLGLKKVPKLSEEELLEQGYVRKKFVLIDPEKCSCFKREREEYCRTCGLFAKKGKKVCECCGKELATIGTAVEDCPECQGEGFIEGEIERWTKLKPFKTSPVQLKAYARFRGHEIPKNSKKVRAMDKENLLRMAARYRDPLYNSVIEFREFQKLASTYGLGWMPAEDGRTHPTFGFTPATGQSSSTGPNAQNRPNPGKMGQLATEFSLAIEAPAGYVLIEGDFKSFHAKTLGLESGDPAYIRLAGLDTHSYLTAFLLKLPDREKALAWPDDQLRDWLNWIKKNHKKMRDKNAKPAILGYGFGLGAEKLWAMNRESFADKRSAQFVIDTLDDTFPITARYRKEQPELAHRQKRLTTKFGAVRWFWNVKGWDTRKRTWTHGKDWERAIAYCPAANAFGHKKMIMRSLASQGLTERYGLINDIHDALMFCCRVELAEECLYTLKREMEAESNVLFLPSGKGFSCEIELKIGPNWAEMEEVEVHL